jgi:SET domain-containing protein
MERSDSHPNPFFFLLSTYMVHYQHVTNEEAERRGSFYDKLQCSYLLDLDVEGKQTNSYTIDATHYGTVSRYFNHSCDPNLVIYPVSLI